MLALLRRRASRIGAVIVGIVIAGAAGVAIVNPRLTRYVESDAFRAEVEKATAKGLHFPAGKYAPIRRTGFLTAASDGFRAPGGRKAMTAMDAHGITATFNPLGVFLRRWQLDEVRIQSGEVGIQTYEPKPEPSPPKPWYHVFLPNRVYLQRVWSEPVDVTWRFRNEKGGFFGTRLLITPHGRDFEYQANGGVMKLALIPDLPLRHAHLLITKKLLTLYALDVAAGPASGGFVHGEGTAGMGEDRSVDFKMKFDELPIREWLPLSWKNHVAGAAAGSIHWKGKNLKLEAAAVEGTLHVQNGRVRRLPFLEKLASIAGKKALEELELNECSAEVHWESPTLEIRNIAIEDKGKFRVEGLVSAREKSLGGAIRLGVTREYLEWLPHPEEIFARERGGYLWTTVHLSGTIAQPQQDLSPRIVEALKESPGEFLALAFRLFGEWLKDAFGGE
jgi:hypothetical protein